MRISDWSSDVCSSDLGGREDDSVVAAFPGIDVVCNRWGLPQGIYRKRLSGMLRRACRGRAIYKSNQMRGAELALSLAQKAGASFIARCGYMLSEFVARAEGEASAEHRRATALENLVRSEEHTSELQSLMSISYAVFCLIKKKNKT